MSTIQLRVANLSDVGSLAAVHVAAWRESYPGILPDEMLAALSVEARTDMWREFLSAPATSAETKVYVAEMHGQIVGFGSCGGQREKALAQLGFGGEISAIYLLRSHQRLGLGRSLMTQMAQALTKLGFVGAALWVLRENIAARGFYERLGGTLVGEKKDERPDATFDEVAYGWRDLTLFVR
ncbi:GNAT family N-acetyltransferase [Acidocella facilis]|uniref:GNAT family N-acetyltransferase n=1 Tax=Acidocella facilis TaxID=525 RepID=UPI000557DEC6|nr:GNAT family N-acetyltransferase [Acidocella facilis]